MKYFLFILLLIGGVASAQVAVPSTDPYIIYLPVSQASATDNDSVAVKRLSDRKIVYKRIGDITGTSGGIKAVYAGVGLLKLNDSTLYMDTTKYHSYGFYQGVFQPTITGLSTGYMPYWNGTALANTTMFYDAANKRWGIGTTTPIATFTLDSLSSVLGFQLSSTTDQTTNYARMRIYRNVNDYYITGEKAGTATLGQLYFNGFNQYNATVGNWFFGTTNTTTANISTAGINVLQPSGGNSYMQIRATNTNSASATIQPIFGVIPTINTSSIGNSTAFGIYPYYQTVGTGPNYIFALGTQSAANYGGTLTNYLTMDRFGKITITDGTQQSGYVFTSNSTGVGSWARNVPSDTLLNYSASATVGTGANVAINLSAPSSAATLTLPSGNSYNGQRIRIFNATSPANGNQWSFGGATVLDAAGATITAINGYTNYVLENTGGTSWNIVSMQSRATVGIGTVQLLSQTANINGKATGSTTLYTVPTGKTLVVTRVVVRVTAATAITNGASASVTASTSGTIYVSNAMSGLTATPQLFKFPDDGISVTASGGENINFVIGTGATGTSQTLSVDLIGYIF